MYLAELLDFRDAMYEVVSEHYKIKRFFFLLSINICISAEGSSIQENCIPCICSNTPTLGFCVCVIFGLDLICFTFSFTGGFTLYPVTPCPRHESTWFRKTQGGVQNSGIFSRFPSWTWRYACHFTEVLVLKGSWIKLLQLEKGTKCLMTWYPDFIAFVTRYTDSRYLFSNNLKWSLN